MFWGKISGYLCILLIGLLKMWINLWLLITSRMKNLWIYAWILNNWHLLIDIFLKLLILLQRINRYIILFILIGSLLYIYLLLLFISLSIILLLLLMLLLLLLMLLLLGLIDLVLNCIYRLIGHLILLLLLWLLLLLLILLNICLIYLWI